MPNGFRWAVGLTALLIAILMLPLSLDADAPMIARLIPPLFLVVFSFSLLLGKKVAQWFYWFLVGVTAAFLFIRIPVLYLPWPFGWIGIYVLGGMSIVGVEILTKSILKGKLCDEAQCMCHEGGAGTLALFISVAGLIFVLTVKLIILNRVPLPFESDVAAALGFAAAGASHMILLLILGSGTSLVSTQDISSDLPVVEAVGELFVVRVFFESRARNFIFGLLVLPAILAAGLFLVGRLIGAVD